MAADTEPTIIAPSSFTPMGADPQHQKRLISPLQLGLIAVLFLFAIAFWFLFSARSVLFSVIPADADINIDGGLQLKLGERYLLRSGDFTISLTAPGYYPQQQPLLVSESSQQSFEYALEKLPGLLNISSTAATAKVLIDDQEVGDTPLNQQAVAAGEHELRLLAPRYLPYRQTIDVTGMGQSQEFEVALEPAWANISITSEPLGATVLIDGEPAGTTPSTLEILQGEHQLSLQMAGFRQWDTELAVSPGVDQSFGPVALQPADGQLQLSSTPAAASVTVDGEYRGQTPLLLELKPGREHRVAVFKAGHSNANRSISLEPGVEEALHVTLRAKLGEVNIQVMPPEAQVIVAGKTYGSGNQSLQLPAVEQQLEVRLDGYRSYRQRFTPRPGLGQQINVQLLTDSAARLADLKPIVTNSAGQQLRLFTPGDFTMGASRREPGRRANEVLHPVSLTRMFYISTYEVSNAQFREFRSEHNSGRVEGSSLNRDRQPAVMVSWNEAALYCNWLSQRENLSPVYKLSNGLVTGFDTESTGYRLPTEAEWAWVARSRNTDLLTFSWGGSYPPTDKVGNFADTSSAYITGRTVQSYNDGQVVSAPIGSFPANHKGLHDLGGNVAEWVHDIYSIASTNGATTVDPMGKQTGNNHVIRGASWAHGTVTELRLSFRDYGQAGRDDVGFRIARYAEQR
ncbi:PEGA domain-containing protein [Halieaceae bacterium IMCC14734]|uniref:PEGA domain-containing protein n=1 Tax=Candidatus Litorirhabdus singularis TaxID=2518993 RepID=A0ABT3TK11_9GAMM|nr:PEGA domain-containing protein [Candidatus Litorirhabdus singularis]MCX2982648.1 PEGA domain-containing protein [Candidatus Litorirhabdus singularis]